MLSNSEKFFHFFVSLLFNLISSNVQTFPITEFHSETTTEVTLKHSQQQHLASSFLASISPSSSSSPASSALCPNSCYCDQDNLYVSCVGDDQWDPNLPELPSTVLRLEVKNYNINDSLSVDYLSTLKSLRELKLTSLSLTSLSNLTFSNLSSLERLDLSLNKLTSLEAGIFTATSYRLKYLDLSSNQLTSIDELFLGCVSLEHLNLQSNRLTNLTINTFLGLVKLTYLNLDDNFITTIELGSFLHLTRLGHLIISNNPISPATRFDSLSTHLKYVDVSNISLTCIPHGISPFIRDLRLSGNQISSLGSGDLDNYLYLNILVLDSNGLSEIQPDSLGRLEYLIKFWCKHNALTTLPSDLPSSLRELYLSNNAFTNLNSTLFTFLVNLERLDLSANLIETIESTVFTNLVHLVELNLSKNKLLDLANLELPASLKHLDFSSNQIVNFNPQIFQSTPNLEHLSVSNITLNNATFNESTNKCIYLDHLKSLNLDKSHHLSEHFLKLLTFSCSNQSNSSPSLIVPNLNELNLIGNHLSSLGANLISKLPSLLTLSFDSNQIDCSLEDNVKLSKWLTRPNVLIKPSKESIKCWLPLQVRNLPLIKLKTDDDKSNNLPATIALPFTGTMENSSKYKMLESNLMLKKLETDYFNDSHNVVIASLPRGLISSNLPTKSNSLSKLNVHQNYASSDLHLTEYNNNNDHLINGNISINNGKHDKPFIQLYPSTEPSSGHSVITNNSNDNNNDSNGLPQILSNLSSDKTDSTASRRAIVSFDNNNDHENDASYVNNSDKHDSSVVLNDQLHFNSSVNSTNQQIFSFSQLINSTRQSETFKRSIINKDNRKVSSSSLSSSSSGSLIFLSSLPSSSGLSFTSSSPLSSPSLLSSSPSLPSSNFVSYGIVSLVIGSLIITIMLCFAITTMVKSRKIYSSITKDTRVDNRSWLHRSVSYLSQNDEVSFLSLNDAVDTFNPGSTSFTSRPSLVEKQ